MNERYKMYVRDIGVERSVGEPGLAITATLMLIPVDMSDRTIMGEVLGAMLSGCQLQVLEEEKTLEDELFAAPEERMTL